MSRTKTTYINFVFTLFVLSFSKNAKSQCFLPEPYTGNTGVNMTLLFQESFNLFKANSITQFTKWTLNAKVKSDH